MDEEQLIQFLSDNLEICVTREYDYELGKYINDKIELKLRGKTISTDYL